MSFSQTGNGAAMRGGGVARSAEREPERIGSPEHTAWRGRQIQAGLAQFSDVANPEPTGARVKSRGPRSHEEIEGDMRRFV